MTQLIKIILALIKMSYQESDYQEDENYSEDEIDHQILRERNEQIRELNEEILHIHEAFATLASMIETQGETLEVSTKNIQTAELETTQATQHLQKAANYQRNTLIMIRDVSLVVGGGVLGTVGFLLGPLVGIGTVIAGAAGGGAVVAGIHKVQ